MNSFLSFSVLTFIPQNLATPTQVVTLLDMEKEVPRLDGYGTETPLFAPFVFKMIIILPRQARDKHRESTQNRVAFP
jgi:hypothetical protein